MRILLISRAFPPVIGGIENHNRDLALWLAKKTDCTLIANHRGKSFLPLFLPYAFIKALFLMRTHDVLLLGDGVLAPLAAAVSLIYPHRKTACVVHGLDIAFGTKQGFLSRVYKSVNLPSLRRLDRIFAVSEHTSHVAIDAGVDPERITIIQNGIDPLELVVPRDRAALDTLLGVETAHQFVIVRIGRYVKHKGVEWFIRNVVPRLSDDVLFVAAGGVVAGKTAGDDDYFPACEQAVRDLALEGKVKLLTNLPRADILTLLNSSDLAVSPNIPVPGTMEGFGINVIEANSCGLPVIASDLEGLSEAVHDGENGRLVRPSDADAYVEAIRLYSDDRRQLKIDGEKAAAFVSSHFLWDTLSDRYKDVLEAELTR